MEESTMIKIGKRLRKTREKCNMTREKFSEKAGISPQFLAEIENGKKGMSVSTLYKICLTFDLSADYILFGHVSKETIKISEPYLSYTEEIFEIVNNIIKESKNNYNPEDDV